MTSLTYRKIACTYQCKSLPFPFLVMLHHLGANQQGDGRGNDGNEDLHC